MPNSERIMVQIGEIKGEITKVRTVIDERSSLGNGLGSEQKELNYVLRNLGIQTPSEELRQSAQLILNKGIPLTKEAIRDLQMFIQSTRGTSEQRLYTIGALANKNLEVTTSHLHSIHEALNGRPLNQVLSDLIKEMDPNYKIERLSIPTSTQQKETGGTSSSEFVKQLQTLVKQSPNVTQAIENVRQHLNNKPNPSRELIDQVGRATMETRQLLNIGLQRFSENHSKLEQIEQLGKERLLETLAKLETNGKIEGIMINRNLITEQGSTFAEMVKQAQMTLMKEPNVERIIEHISKTLLDHPQLQTDKKDQLKHSLNEAARLSNNGREMAGRQELNQLLTQLAEYNSVNDNTKTTQDSYFASEQQASMQLNSKSIAVTTVTQRVAEMTFTFKELQRDVSKKLDTITRLTELYKNQSQQQVKPILETTIKLLDNTILKSDMMLLTNMKTEKELMQASSQLAEAKKLLNRGNYQDANRIVQEVKLLVERIQFQPSETKIKHYTNEKFQIESLSMRQQVMHYYSDISQPIGKEPTARQVYESLRGLGLNRETEIAQMMVASKQQNEQNAKEQNMKSALMQLLREEENSRITQQASQAITNITGQQLLSKTDTSNQLQNLFFTLPFLLQEKTENLQVFVNSRNEGEKVDWENCQLYFLIETPKLGEVGILLTVADRNLAVTIKNDRIDFKEKMKPIVEKYINLISEIGYNVSGIKFTNMRPNEINQEGQRKINEQQAPIFSEKGFDYKI